MPRNDRWRPKQVHRLVTPEMRAEAQRRREELSRAAGGQTASMLTAASDRRKRARFPGSTQLVLCNHGVPWTVCVQCSKPRGVP